MTRADDSPVPPQPPTLGARVEARPPALWPSTLGWRAGLRRWLAAGRRRLPAAAAPPDRFAEARTDFLDTIADLDDRVSADPALMRAIVRSRSLRELWHLRTAVHQAVSVSIGESEALRRSARLNRHFPLRAGADATRPSSSSGAARGPASR